MLGCLEHPKEAEGMLGKMVMDAMETYIGDSLEESGRNRKIEDQVNQVADQARELSELMQKKVTIEELVQETGLTEEYIREAVRLSGNRIEYIAAEQE